jgi:hypothetical protein
MPQKSRTVVHANSPRSPAERAQRYRLRLREVRRDPRRRRLPIGIIDQIIKGLVKHGYLGPQEIEDVTAVRQPVSLVIWDELPKLPKRKRTKAR